jgi:hypothetical protein
MGRALLVPMDVLKPVDRVGVAANEYSLRSSSWPIIRQRRERRSVRETAGDMVVEGG